ncbi:MAG: thioredoxin family protein [Roseovarius sp.]
MKQIKVYGPGCKRCDAAEAMVRETAAKLGIAVEVEKVTDPKSIAMAGVISTPGISIDGKLVHAGGLPEPERLKGWLAA